MHGTMLAMLVKLIQAYSFCVCALNFGRGRESGELFTTYSMKPWQIPTVEVFPALIESDISLIPSLLEVIISCVDSKSKTK